METIYVAGGCLWGVQHFFKSLPGVLSTEAGRANGSTSTLDGPYDGYAECVKVDFDEEICNVDRLMEYLFEIIDPYSVNKQGNDVGPKYRTGIYSTEEEHLKAARNYIASRTDGDRIALEVKPLANYVRSAEEHQDHLERFPEDYYLCHIPLKTMNKYRQLAEQSDKCSEGKKTECFPDGTLIDEWFYECGTPEPESLGKSYLITEYGVVESPEPQTAALQALIDRIHAEGGGLLVVPRGTFVSGSLYFKQGVNLYISEGGVLKGSDDISDYGIGETRIEGQTCTYYHALINANELDGFTICGSGTIDGNGLRSWKAFWQRRIWNPACTNKDEQRARLLYLSNCNNVTISGLTLQNSQFWTSHLYKCDHIKYLGVKILSPKAPVKAPSTDAIDIDVCHDIHIKNCYFAVNDDSVVLKGGKGPYADTAPENGSNERVLIEDCTYGFCHGCLTCGSESVHNRNILMRRIKIEDGFNLLWLKMRPDTPQNYEYITLEDIDANVSSCININPWRQFYDLGDRTEIPKSYASHITLKNSKVRCYTYLDIELNEEQYQISDLTLENLQINAKKPGLQAIKMDGLVQKDINLHLDPAGTYSEQDEEELKYRHP